MRSDLDLIRSEVLRCRAVLDQMAADAGQSVGEQLVPMSMAALAKQICAGLASEPAIAVQVATPDQTLLVPVRALTQALRGLVKMARMRPKRSLRSSVPYPVSPTCCRSK